ncbi:hypothetical protein [Rhizorhabdus wittichii]|nr:hypothetical protein [Rhizorhabdus wittichii]
MDRAEGAGLGISIAGHVALLVILSLNLMSVRKLPKLSEPMDVMLVDKAGLTSAAPEVSKAPPQAAQAPEVGPTEETAGADPRRPPQPAPDAAPACADPEARAQARPSAPAPAPEKAVEKPTPAPAKPKPKATSLGTDFLKGIPVEKSTGKAAAPRAAAISPIAMNGLVALIASQVKPCYTIPAGGTDTTSIISRIRLRLKKDGSIAAAPEVIGNLGVTPANQPYVRQMNEAATRALQRCAPYKLPPDLFEAWQDLIFTFRPAQMS